MTRKPALFFGALFALSQVFAQGAGSSSGASLVRNTGARAGALGEAFSSMTNDITAMEFNPASLSTLKSGQLSMDYERGLFDDSFSKAMVGMQPMTNGVFGLSVGYYNSGSTDLYDGVGTQQSVTAQRDFIATLGYGNRFKSIEWGSNIRYLRSELAETNTASGMSFDLGGQYQFASHWRLGFSGPVYRSKLKYANAEEKLPGVYRAGVQWNTSMGLATGKLPLTFLFDVPYDAVARKPAYALGAETFLAGVMALRLGLNTRSDAQEFSIGTGFQFQRMNLDYSFGLADNSNLSSVHKINFAFRFDNPSPRTEQFSRSVYQIYQVKEGETLETIALSRYGSSDKWVDIFSANRHLYDSPEDITPGSKILVPPKKGS